MIDVCERSNYRMKDQNDKQAEMESEKSGEVPTGWDSVKQCLTKERPAGNDVYSAILGKRHSDNSMQGCFKVYDGSMGTCHYYCHEEEKTQQRWHKSIHRWDYDDIEQFMEDGTGVKDIMSLLRQQHIRLVSTNR